MPTEFRLPDIGEGTAEGEIIKWLVSEGDVVAEDTPLVEVMTDKATVEIPSPRAGKILELRAKEGEVVDVGSVILVFGDVVEGAADEAAAGGEVDADAGGAPSAEPLERPTAPSPAEDRAAAPEPPSRIEALAADAPFARREEEEEIVGGAEATSAGAAPDEGGASGKSSPAEEAAVLEEARRLARAELEAEEQPPASVPAEAGEAAPSAEPAPPEPASPRPVWEAPEPVAGRALATPATRRLARELGVDLTEVRGSGKGGRVMKEDVRSFARARAEQTQRAATAEPEGATVRVFEPAPDRLEPEPAAGGPGSVQAPAGVAEPPEVEPVGPAAVATTEAGDDRRGVAAERVEAGPEAPTPAVAPPAAAAEPAPAPAEERIPFRGLRRRIAARMVEAKRTIPHFTYVEECDMTEIVALRERAKSIGAPHGIRVTYLPFIIRALVEALKTHPIVNAALDEAAGEIVLKRSYNVGIATATERGLVVPVVKNADRLGIFDLAREIDRLATEAREGRSKLEDLQGGTITVTSTGNIGGVLATPIINYPEVAILGVTAIRKRPVVRDDEIVIRHMVNFSLSLDHRVVDGADGALFLRDMISVLEDPKLMLLGSP